MKKMLAVMLSLILLLCACPVSAETDIDFSSMTSDELAHVYQQVLTETLKRGFPSDKPETAGEKAITFRGIPWGTTYAEAKDLLSADGISFNLKKEDCRSWEADFYWTGKVAAKYSFEKSGYFGNPSCSGMTVGGFPATYLGLYFLKGYDDNDVYEDEEHAQFYLAYYYMKPVDMAGAYDVLCGKLSQLYGEGKERYETSSWSGSSGSHVTHTKWTTWYGAEDTGVYIWYNYEKYENGSIEDETMYIVYGKSNSIELLQGLEAAMAREQLEQAESDMSGL